MKQTVEVHIPEDQMDRTATRFIQAANEFSCYILVSRNGNSVNAKSLLGFISLGMKNGTTVKLSAEGDGAEQALESLSRILRCE